MERASRFTPQSSHKTRRRPTSHLRSTIGAEGLKLLCSEWVSRWDTLAITTYFFMTQHTSFNVHLVNVYSLYILVNTDLGDRVKCVSDFLEISSDRVVVIN